MRDQRDASAIEVTNSEPTWVLKSREDSQEEVVHVLP